MDSHLQKVEMTTCKGYKWPPLLLVILLSCLNCASSQISDQAMPPEITRQINIQNTLDTATLVSGSVLNLQIDVRGTKPLRYIWRQNDTVVKNDTLDYYRVQKMNESHAGIYRVTVENSFGKVRSLPFKLVVKELGQFPAASDKIVQVQAGKFAVLYMPEISYVDIPSAYSIEWEQNDAQLQSDLKYYITINYNLALLNIPVSLNQSKFRVKLTHLITTYSETYSGYFILSVTGSSNQNAFSPPEFVVLPRNTSAKSGQSVKFECAVNGQPLDNVQINWYKYTTEGRTAITGSSKYTLSSDRRSLTINTIDVNDGGTFECEGLLTAQTAYSPINQKAALTVLVPPSISSAPPSSITKDFQESVAMSCAAQGDPQPELGWYFNDAKLVSSNSTRYQISSNGSLSIVSVDLQDSGVYQCIADNEAGEAATYTWLVVNSAEPTILEAPKNTVVAEHQDTTFTCKVNGGPQPKVYWKKDGINITIGGRIHVVQDQLLIGQVEMTDSGLYSCNAVNIKGSISANATLRVILKTQIIKPPQNVSCKIGTDILLDCSVRSDPSVSPDWTWFFYQAPDYQKKNITSGVDNAHIFENGTLRINNLLGRNSGKYECVVTSAGGNDQRIAFLNIIDKPAKPDITNVTLYDQIPNSVLINWTLSYDGDTPITKFIINSRRESFSGTNIDSPWETVNSNVRPDLWASIVSNLLPSRYYRFQLIAVNIVGESDSSDAAPKKDAIRMPVQPPSAAPLNLFCDPGQEREINVSWEPPPESTWNGDLLGYIIYFKIDGFSDDTEKYKNVSDKDLHKTVVENLAYYKKYRVRIAAYNERGPGINSSDFFVTTRQGIPSSSPQNVTLASPTSTTIRLEWEPPPSRLLNGANQGYVVDLKQDGFSRNPIIIPFDEQNPTGRQTYTISNLNKYTQYEIEISCRTAAGAGPKSPSQTIRTLEDVPGPVAELLIDNISAKSLRVNWKPPLELNGVLTGYEISNQVKNSLVMESLNRTSNTTNYTFKDLMYETKYVISVRAWTQMGPGPARTTEITSGVPPELPGPPTRLAVTNIEARSVLLQFIPGYDGKTSITLWVVEAQVTGSNSWDRVYNISDPAASQITVYNLRPYTKYRLRIIAQNIVDFSVPSEPCNEFETKQAAPGMPPQDITPRVNSSTSIRIRWMQIPKSEWNGDSLGYKIFYRRWSKDVDVNTTSQSDIDLVHESSWGTVDLSNSGNMQEYFLSKLEEWMDYQIQMLSYNVVGNSSLSPILSERTDEDVPSSSPLNLMAVPKSSTTVFVSWSPVPILQRNGNIQGYKVKYTAQRTGAVAQYMEVNGANSLNTTLTGLRKFTQYSVQVLASTRVGDGILSNAVPVRTDSDVPGPPVIIYFPQVNETSATIVWQTPDEPNGEIINYRVSYKRKDQPDSAFKSNEVEHFATVYQYTVSGLEADLYYVFSVEAKTKNGYGEAAYVDVYTISNRDRPDPPTNLRIDTSEILSRSISIVWTPGNNNFGPIRNFTVQYRKRGSSWQTVAGPIKPQLTSYTVKGLQPTTWYSFRVAAVNDIGMSDFSAGSNEVQTQPDKPDGAPQNVKIVALNRTSIKITWDDLEVETSWQYHTADGTELVVANLQPGQKYTCNIQAYNYLGGGPWSQAASAYLEIESTWNGQLINDIIQYREEGRDTFREDTIPYGLFNANLQRLIIGVRYEIQILSANEVGRGPPSVLQIFLVGDVAPFAAPLDIKVTNKSSTELQITWKPPSDDTTNGKLIGYKIHYWQSASEKCEMSQTMLQTVTDPSIVLGNLKPYTIYCSTVQAVNIAGEGPESTPIPKQTSEDFPGAPENVRFANITLRELTVLWEAPRTPNGNITNYRLQYFTSSNNEKNYVSTIRLSGEKRQQHVTDLLENQRYTFSLVAINNIGNGTVVEVNIVTGPQKGSPEAPLQPIVTLKLKTIYLSWANQNQGNSPIQGYQICYLEEGKQDCVPILDVNHVEPSAQLPLSALKPSTEYSFIVRAINSNGISPPSAPSAPFETSNSLIASPSGPFYTQWWFLVIVALSGVIVILLTITLLCLQSRRKKFNELKRSTTITTVMSATPEPEENRYPALELRQSQRSVTRNGKVQNNANNIYARSPPRPSPASVTYSEGLNLPASASGASAMAARKPRVSDDNSSVLSEKPSNLGDSSDDVSSDDSDDSSTDSIVKAPVPSSPPPPAFSSHYSRSSHNNLNGARAGSSGIGHHNNKNHNPSRRLDNPHNAYTYTDSEADSSHYAFSLNNGNILVNNVAGARTPLSGFSSFV